ncbi:MAG: sugar ABC transporter permease [Vampirovibrionales bacterium]
MASGSQRSSQELWPNTFGWLLILPVLAGLALLTGIPTLVSIGLSLTQWDMLGTPQWVGFSHYQSLLTNPLQHQVMKQTLSLVVWVTGLEVIIGLAMALWIHGMSRNTSQLWAKQWLQWVSFTPVLAPLISVSLVWGWLYDPTTGLFNQWLKALHLLAILNQGEPIAWLYNEKTALAALIVLHVWKHVGYTVILFIAGLQAIPTSVQEAALLDGARFGQQFWHVLLPQLMPTTAFIITVTLINTSQTFDSIYLLTQGGPNHATSVWVFELVQQAFEAFNIGQAAAMGVMLFVVLALLSSGQQWLQRRHQ